MRTFISIEIPDETKKEIIKIQEQLPGFCGKKTEFENLHLTLKFLGEVDEEKVEEVKEKLRGIKYNPFETEIDSIGFFDNRKSSKYGQSFIVWIHMKNCDELQKQIDLKLDKLFEKEKRFMSHLTIARVKNIKDKKKFLEELKKIRVPKITFIVDSFYLMDSKLNKRGPKYSVLGKYLLD